MRGVMMDAPLTLGALLAQVERVHGRGEIVSRGAGRTLRTSTDGQVIRRRPDTVSSVPTAVNGAAPACSRNLH